MAKKDGKYNFYWKQVNSYYKFQKNKFDCRDKFYELNESGRVREALQSNLQHLLVHSPLTHDIKVPTETWRFPKLFETNTRIQEFEYKKFDKEKQYDKERHLSKQNWYFQFVQRNSNSKNNLVKLENSD